MRKGLRYDPLYRVIDEPTELRSIEGKFRGMFDRLKRISSLGTIPQVFEMAKYPKYEHMIGTIHQVNSLLEVVGEEVIPKRYRQPLLVAAIFIHLGHLPFTYSSERALLLASNLGDRSEDNRIKHYVKTRIRRALTAAGYDEDKQDLVMDRLFSLRDFRHLYRYFSAQLLVENWGSVEDRVEGLGDDDLKVAVRNLIDTDCDGYQYLQVADEADFVQRDGLYFGTVKIDIAPKHLYSPLTTTQPDVLLSEQRLIEYNRQYLAEKFYENLDVVSFTRLYEKILASLIWSSCFELTWLEEYDDRQMERLTCERFDSESNRTRLSDTWTQRASDLFQGNLAFRPIFKLDGVWFGAEPDAIDVEYHLAGRRESERGLLRYPFETGILLSVDYDRRQSWLRLSDHDLFSLVVFQDESNRALLEILKVASRLRYNLSVIRHAPVLHKAIGRQLSWTGEVRFDNEAVFKSLSRAISYIEQNEEYEIGEYVRDYLQSLSKIVTFSDLWEDEDNFFWRAVLMQRVTEPLPDELSLKGRRVNFLRGLLELPVRLLQYKSTRVYLDEIHQELLAELGTDIPRDQKGEIFEALWLVEKIVEKRGNYQIFFNGLVITDPKKPTREQDEHEFDVIELLINDARRAECNIYACSIADDYRQNNREPLTMFADYLHSNFPDLTIHTYYVIPQDKGAGDWRPMMEDAGRNYRPDL